MIWHRAIAPVFWVIRVRAWARQRAFFNVVAAQFFSSLAGSALLIAAIGLLLEQHAAGGMTPGAPLGALQPRVLTEPAVWC